MPELIDILMLGFIKRSFNYHTRSPGGGPLEA